MDTKVLMKKIGSIMKIQRITYFYLLSILLFVGCVSQENELTKPVENREIHIYMQVVKTSN